VSGKLRVGGHLAIGHWLSDAAENRRIFSESGLGLHEGQQNQAGKHSK